MLKFKGTRKIAPWKTTPWKIALDPNPNSNPNINPGGNLLGGNFTGVIFQLPSLMYQYKKGLK